jgi:hypothetical protein
LKDKGHAIVVNCKRCGKKMAKWQRSKKDEEAHPFPFDSICGKCISPEEVSRVYPNTKGTILKSLGNQRRNLSNS